MTWACGIEEQEFYFLDEVIRIVRMSERDLRRIIRRGRLAVHQEKTGATIRIRHQDLLDFINGLRCEVQPDTPKPRHAKARS